MFLPILLLTLVPISSSVSLPVISRGPTNVTAVPGDSVTFLCEASGKPTPDILIVRKDVDYTLPKHTGDRHSDANSNAVSVFKTLNNVRRDDSGWYECIASNSAGHVISEAYLEVVADPCDRMKCSSRKYCHVTDYTAGTAECRCKECEDMSYKPVCGSDCTSYLNMCQMKSSSCESGLGLSVLHKGECKVEEAQLKVGGATEVFEGDKMSLTCEFSGFPEPTAFRWAKIMKNGRQKIVGSGKMYTVKSADLKDSGEYRCIAQQCMNRVKSEVVSIEVVSRAMEEPRMELKTCRVYGDPHIQTFDGKKYDFMGRCNYILAVDCSYMNKWMVLGQFTPCGDGVTCLEQITLYYGSMKPLTLARGWIVGQNGEKFRLHKNKAAVIEEATVTYTGLAVEVELPGGVHLVYDGFWGVQITVEEGAETCGLCGDNNGDLSDDVIKGRYGQTGGDITVFGQSWAMWNADWCGLEEIPSDGPDNSTCVDMEMKEVEQQCDSILQSEVFAECITALGGQYFRDSCVMDGCRTQVERFEGSPVCAVTHSLAQICEVNGFIVPENFLELIGCGPEREFQESVYNSGCPLAGNPPFLDQ